MAVVNIPETDLKRVVIVGAGFAGINLAKRLVKEKFQVVLFDKNNYHQFQPLLYQVAMAGLEPSSITFPLRKMFQNKKNIHIRIGELLHIDSDKNTIVTDIGICHYDYLVIAIGAKTNYYKNAEMEEKSFSLKAVSEAMYLRNQILQDYETAIITRDYETRQGYIDTVIVGGGATGVELAGALAEMKTYILPRDYYELNANEVDIYLIHSGNQLLPSMSPKSGKAAEDYLTKMGVQVIKNKRVTATDGENVTMNDGSSFKARKVIWAAGITGNTFTGLGADYLDKSNRIIVDEYHTVVNHSNIFAIGDISIIKTKSEDSGHAQVAQVAIQQAKNLAHNISKNNRRPFQYKDKGSMATIGRNKAVVDLPHLHFKGFVAWVLWLFVHLASILGTKNKVFVLINWVWNYLTYDQSLRLILKAKKKDVDSNN